MILKLKVTHMMETDGLNVNMNSFFFLTKVSGD